jgi:hypothetical protein
MPKKVHLLRDVQPTVLTLCKQGANRQRIFLMKEQKDEGLITLPGGGEVLLKAEGDSWSTIYCVVAEPGTLEDPGMGDGADSGIEDLWKDEQEIRKAAHFFAKSDRLVTGLHGTVEPYGTVVENAVALSDFTIDGPDGQPHMIKKGSWYVCIEPSDEGRAKIDAGEFTGLSLEGSGYRELVELEKSQDEEEKVSLLKRLAVAIGLAPEALLKDSGTLKNDPEEDGTLADEKKIEEMGEKVENISKAQSALTTAVEGLVGTVNGLVERLDANKKKDEQKEEVTAADLKKSLDDFTSTVADKLEEFDGKLEQLADSGSVQDDDKNDLKKSKTTVEGSWGGGIL